MKFIKHFWGYFLMVALIYFLHQPIGGIPPMGRLFSPFEGFLQNSVSTLTATSDSQLQLEGVKEEVKVIYDENRVPHIFANNEDDLYYAQGYVIAKDRIWQMEFYTLVAAGRLTEVVGERALEYDKYNRGLGMAKAAAEIAQKLESDPVSSKILTAYTAGVNKYISTLDFKDLPVEYKILGYRPANWSNYKTILMLMNMRNTLNGGSNDYRLSNVVAKYGLETVKDLFPDYPTEESPIIPTGTKWDFTPLPVNTPEKIMADNGQEALAFNVPEPRPQIGSNNWAVSGSKSATGQPILSNDPHLGLTLPSIWYQMQLTTPTMNVCGVALPGSPGIVIGFNKDIAWGVTNVGSDVMDFYKIKFKDNTKSQYWYEGQWKPVTKRIETYKLKSGKIVQDTILYTHHGPIIYDVEKETNFGKNAPAGHAMRWIAHETGGSDLLAFYMLNKAKNYDDYRKALATYTAPAQNFIFASNQNDIAITPNGKLPLKWKNQGKYILDGSMAAHDWQGWIPAEQNPTVKNPPRGFVSSANQFSTDQTYPYYLGWKFAPSGRGIRINERLTAMNMATVDSLRSIQNDNFNVSARRIMPTLISYLSTSTDKSIAPAIEVIKKWDLVNSQDAVAATIYERWIKELSYWIWNDEFSADDKMMYPSEDRTFEMLKKQTNAKWFDNTKTKDKVETINDIVLGSFKATIDTLTLKNGQMTPETWAWAKVKNTTIKHLVPAFISFSRKGVVNGGGPGIVNATTESTGPSWRMIVQLDKDWPKGYGLYPGGQSGNPGSKYYDNMIDNWAAGKLNTLVFMKNKDEKIANASNTITIKPKK
jgi:penicillin G amidase